MISREIRTDWFGLVPYKKGLGAQSLAHQEVMETQKAVILGMEHLSAITLGVRSQKDLDIKVSEEELRLRSVELVEVDRGGEATLHSPGQLVIYPIVPLTEWGIGVRDFVSSLEKATILFFDSFGIGCERGSREPGIYSSRGKIGFLGIKVDRRVTRHGIALNIHNDLSLFSLIRSCGREVETFDKLAHYDVNATQVDLFHKWIKFFTATLEHEFGVELSPSNELNL